MEAPARVVLVEAVPGKAGGLTFEPDFVERNGGGITIDLARIVAGD
jgi:hypothetical protein